MTAHAPQSEDARREVAGLMSATCNIMNAQTNNNIAGVVFDALVGSYILSLPETRVDRDVFMNIVVFLEDRTSLATLNIRLDKYSVPRDSGRALLSVLFPIDFYYHKDETIIRQGILVSGVLDSSNIGSASGSIIQALYKDYGQSRTVDFLTDIYKMAGAYMDTYGFSVGLDDCFLTGKEPQKTIEYEVQRVSMLVKSMGVQLADPLEEERRERQIKGYLDTAKNLGSKISKENMKADNSFNVMAKSGAKGSVSNIAFITGILGQQFLAGQRMPQSISGGTRSLHYFAENELDPSARGFISNSYLTGLTPAEFFFALTAARLGVAESSTSISVVGHIHHKIVKSLEDIKIVGDGSVRNSADIVFQFAYGEDSFDASLLEAVKTKTGNFTSFINLKRVAGRINQKYGF
jgi:DNA-directed RNA polymerase beta' subunit